MMSADERQLPHDRDAERSILGSVLRDNTVYDDVAAIIRAESFYQSPHYFMFQGVSELIKDGIGADPVTLCNWAKENQLTADIGGNAYIADIWDAAPSAGNAVYYAKIVLGHAIKRSLIRQLGEVLKMCYDTQGAGDWKDVLQEAERRVFDLGARTRKSDIVHFKNALTESLNDIDQKMKREEGEVGRQLYTRFRSLDTILGGIDPGDVIIIAARPGNGKTALLTNMMVQMASHGDAVFIVSLEQPKKELADRALAAGANVNSQKIRKGNLSEKEVHDIVGASSLIEGFPIYIDDNPEQTMTDILSGMRRMKRLGCRACFVDYLQLITPEGGGDRQNREQVVSAISRQLKLAARRCEIPVFALAQVNRESDKRNDKRLKMSDLRESGGIEANADIVMLLQPPEDNEPLRVEIEVAKARKGTAGVPAIMAFDKAVQRFADWNPN